MSVVAGLKHSEDDPSVKPGYAVIDLHARRARKDFGNKCLLVLSCSPYPGCWFSWRLSQVVHVDSLYNEIMKHVSHDEC